MKKQIPWQVRSAALLVDPGATWQSYTPWGDHEWIVVTMSDDGVSRWWSVLYNDTGEYDVYEIEQP